MIAELFSALPLVLAPVQETPAEPTPVAVLDELIQRTNGLGAFRVRYSMEGLDGEPKTLLYEYLPEDKLHMAVDSETQGRLMESWIDGSRMSVQSIGPQGTFWGEGDCVEARRNPPRWFALLDEHFPLSGEWLVDKPELLLNWQLNEHLDKVDFQCSVSSFRGLDWALLGWLNVLQSDPSQLHVTEDAVVQEHPRYRASISRKTGFLDELSMVGNTGKVAYVRLVALDTDVQFESTEFLPPKRPENAQDVSEEIARIALAPELVNPRRTTFQRVDGLLSRGEIEWATRAKEDLQEVLRALHEDEVAALADRYRARIQVQQKSFFDGLQERLTKGETRAALEPEVAAFRAELVQSLDEGLPAVQSRWAPPPEQTGQSAMWGDLMVLENGALQQLYDEHIKRPLLGDFDAAAERFLRG